MILVSGTSDWHARSLARMHCSREAIYTGAAKILRDEIMKLMPDRAVEGTKRWEIDDPASSSGYPGSGLAPSLARILF